MFVNQNTLEGRKTFEQVSYTTCVRMLRAQRDIHPIDPFSFDFLLGKRTKVIYLSLKSLKRLSLKFLKGCE